VLILGQDPYHGPGQAHGLSFSVRDGVPIPPSLRNVFKECAADVGAARAAAGSHAGRGWEQFTDATIHALNGFNRRVVFLLWGGYARKKAGLVTNPQHVVEEAGHPSPLNPRGFLGSRPFSAANKALADAGLPVIDW
jgi:uracil-DNA glycosylase